MVISAPVMYRKDILLKDTPRKKKIRDKLVQKFSDDWQVDLKKIPTIRYKKYTGLKGLWKKFFGAKHSVFAMYWFFRDHRRHNEDFRKFDNPISHDNIPVEGVPFKYELHGNWQIEEEDLKYLFGGPLIDQHGDLLVPVDSKLKKLQRILPSLTILISFISAIIFLVYRIYIFSMVL